MMNRSTRIAWLIAAALIASCSKRPEPQPAAESASTTRAVQPLAAEDANVLRAKLTAGGVPTEYAAHFDGDQLTRIVEHRRVENATLGGEYEFKGARLLHYRGAKLTKAVELELQFDMQGVLLAGQAPDVSEEDIRALRNRAQLLRSHALAQRATRTHQ